MKGPAGLRMEMDLTVWNSKQATKWDIDIHIDIYMYVYEA